MQAWPFHENPGWQVNAAEVILWQNSPFQYSPWPQLSTLQFKAQTFPFHDWPLGQDVELP